MLQYFLSLRTVHIAHPAKRVLPSKIAELDPITDTSLLFPYFFGAGLPLAAGGRHCRTGRRTIRSECVTPPPLRRHRDEGRLMLFINFRRCEPPEMAPCFLPAD